VITTDQVEAMIKQGIKVERILPPPPDPAVILNHMYHILRGVQVARDNGMIPEQLLERVLGAAIDGAVKYLSETVGPAENTVEIIMQAIGIQREIYRRTA
jgi:hypothetical protein